MTIYQLRYYMSPALILVLGCVFIALGILGIIFRSRVKDVIVSGQRGLFGDWVGDRMQAAPMWGLVVAFCAFIGFGVLFIVLGVVGVATNAHVYPQPN